MREAIEESWLKVQVSGDQIRFLTNDRGWEQEDADFYVYLYQAVYPKLSTDQWKKELELEKKYKVGRDFAILKQ